jgi:hypothetical protein
MLRVARFEFFKSLLHFRSGWRVKHARTGPSCSGCSPRILSLTPVMLAILVAGCAYPNQFRNVGAKFPHAVIIGDKVGVMAINGQPTSFWRSSERFRIPLGTNVLRTAHSDWRETFGYEKVMFVATARSEYVLSRKRDAESLSPFVAQPHPTTSNAWVIHDRRECVLVEQKDLNGQRRAVAVAPRQGYVFGVSSSREAIAQYRKENP